MKRKILVLSMIVIVFAIITAGTLAYFNAEEYAHNIITTGGVSVELQEWADEDGTLVPFEDVANVMPNTSVSKIVQVENTGADAWIRVSVAKAIELAEGQEGEVDLTLVAIDFDTENWTEKDGYYYYNKALAAGEVTEPLFTEVAFAPEMGNMYQNSTATVDVIAQAVQAANNGESALDAAGWPEAE